MKKNLNDCKNFLSHPSTGIVFLVIAVVVKILLQIFFFSMVDDKLIQLHAAKNLLAGHGITISHLSPGNQSSEIFSPLTGWPPGYSIMLAPLLWIFNNDYKTAALVFDIACVFPFFFYLVRIVNYLNMQKWLKNLFILFAGFYFYPVNSGTSTDLFSFICVLAGFYYLLLLMKDNNRPFRLVLLLSLFLFLAGFFRYSYIPVAFCFPILLGIAGLTNKKRQWVKASCQTVIVLGILMSALLVFQYYYTGSAVYINTKETGFFPENLVKMYPVVPASFFDVEFSLSFFTRYAGGNYMMYGKILGYLGYILFAFLLVYGIRWIWNKKFLLKNDIDYFIFSGSGISLAICALLFYLSVRNSANILTASAPWTYIQEFRYFIFIVVFIQLISFACLFNRYRAHSRFWKITAVCCALLFALQFTFGVYRVTKLILFRPLFSNLVSYKKEMAPLIQITGSSEPVPMDPSIHYSGELRNQYFYFSDVTTKQQ
jgi:hypothetical protein